MVAIPASQQRNQQTSQAFDIMAKWYTTQLKKKINRCSYRFCSTHLSLGVVIFSSEVEMFSQESPSPFETGNKTEEKGKKSNLAFLV